MTFLVILVVLFISFLVLNQALERMYQKEKIPHRATPEKIGISFEEVHIPAEKGSQLYGWWIPVSPFAPTLILVHGWGRNVERMMPYISKLRTMGYNLLAFDARNHGSSTPEKHPTVWTFAQDIRATVHFVIESNRVLSKKIGIIGLSVGGGAAIDAAGLDKQVQSVVSIGAISHPVEVMKLEFQKRHIPYFPLGWLLLKYIQMHFGLNFEHIAPINNISQAQAHIFLIHGDEDATIPLAQGKALKQAGNPERTFLWVVPGKGHSNCYTHPQFWEKVQAFLQETIPITV